MGSITHSIGSIFQPIFHLFGWILAFLYGVIPNYGIAIALLTIVIMGALTPFTVKSTKSMMAMQKLQPEIKKLQQKYKGPENRQVLNEELMRLYREAGANPVGGCLPILLQAPFLFILYSVIRGLTNVTPKGVVEPRYIPTTSKMYHNLVASHGQITSFGFNLALKPFSHHSSAMAAIPYFVMVAVAVGLQYFQMAQMNNRNKVTGQQLPSQQLALQRAMPIFFAYFYIIIPAAVVLYMVVSTIIRIITQDIMFRTGISNPTRHGVERALPGASKESSTSKESPTSEETPAPKPPAEGKPSPSSPKPAPQMRSRSKRKRRAR